MENLKKIAIDSTKQKYGLKEKDIEIIDMVDYFIVNFEKDNKFYSFEVSYDKDNKPVSKLLKTTEKIPPVEFSNIEKDSAPVDVLGDTPKDTPADKGRNYSLESLKEIIEEFEKNEDVFLKTISDLENEIASLKKNSNSELEKLKKDYAELERKYKRDTEVSSEVAKYIKSMETKRKVTQEQIDLIKKLISEGKTEMEIVKLADTSKGTVWRVKKGLL